MFKSVIRNSPLVNDIANDFFDNIYGEAYSGDISFVSTLRALVHPRIEADDHISVNFYRSAYTEYDVKNSSISMAVKTICEYFDPAQTGNIYIHSFEASNQEDNYACLELMKSSFCSVYNGYHRLEKVTEFYRKQFLSMCFINPDCKSVVIFVDHLDIRKMHYLQCAIFAFLPWYFDPQNGVSELEMELINSLREKTSVKYEEAIAKIADQYDFRTAKVRKLLAGFETRYEKIECDSLRNSIQISINNIGRLNSQIGDQIRYKNDLEIRLLGLERKIQETSGDSEIMEYFLCNDKLVLIDVTDRKILFGVKTYIEYFDEDMADASIGNHNSYLYKPEGRDGNAFIPEESMEKLMKSIFIDQTLKIKVCAVYELDINGHVNGKNGYPFGHEFHEYMPNPHINGYNCLGNYHTVINSLLVNRDYIGAIEQCIASAKSLNFGDSTVMNLFANAIYNTNGCTYNNRCIELPNKNVVTPLEAINWIEEQESDNDE